MARSQSQVKGRAALTAAVVLGALLALGGLRVGLHAAGVTTQQLQATQHLLGGSGGLAEGGGPPGHR
jgi:hypothetical protein